MAPLQLQDLNPEDDIFAGIDCYGDSKAEQENSLPISARSKAKKNLAVSSDSPFSGHNGFDHQNEHLKNSRQRTLLKQEAAKILKERENIKGKQTEILNDEVVVRKVKDKPQLEETHSPQQTRTNTSNVIDEPPRANVAQTQAKFRPLTGRIDCPNCSCDARSSICSLCIKFDRRASIFSGSEMASDRSSIGGYNDNNNSNKKRCTLKELRQRYASNNKLDQEVSSTVSDRVVPGRVYTISRALDDKRSKLAQAIADLQLMKDQLRQKGNRLDEERKLVQLYKDQWRYGPGIGGPKSSSRERIGNVKQARNYESRLDPQLARDSKAIEGFRHIEPGLRLRQYDKKPSPRQALNSSKRRSKSLESLRRPKTASMAGNRGEIASNNQSLRPQKKSSSDADLSSPTEQLEDEVSAFDTSPPASVVEERLEEEVHDDGEEEEARDKIGTKEATKVQKVAWIPVFGETEIKTVKQKPTVKIGVIESASNSPTSRTTESRSILKQATSNKSKESKVTNERLVVQANRKLKFASDLLSQEHRDSTTKNQLIIRKAAPSNKLPVSTDKTSANDSKLSTENKNISNELKIREMLLIEEQLNEHQKQIAKLIEIQQQQQQGSTATNVSKVNNGPHCNHQASHTSSNRIPLGNKSLINNLRDRLNKTKTRLSKNLESEREKYMRLKLKVDTSLRKQSDLEKENELLKQSLNQCIDTCLKDITQTFESLSNSLADSVGSSGNNNRHPIVGSDNNSNTGADMLEIYSPDSGDLLLKNAAQVMNDNNKIKEMKSRMDAVMEQRREIFNELSKEKQKSNQLELQLKRNQDELSNLLSIKQKLEMKLKQKEASQSPVIIPSTSSSIDPPIHTLPTQEVNNDLSSNTEPLESSTTEDTFSGSIDRYRSYIKSLSPDMATLRQERKLILNEFDNIKKMLSEINTES